MPRRHEPVWEMTGFFLPDVLLSDSSDTSEGFRLHFEPGSIFMPLSDPPSDFLTSSPDQREFLSTCECFSASVCGRDSGLVPPKPQVREPLAAEHKRQHTGQIKGKKTTDDLKMFRPWYSGYLIRKPEFLGPRKVKNINMS